jgi:hypothetical protein
MSRRINVKIREGGYLRVYIHIFVIGLVRVFGSCQGR